VEACDVLIVGVGPAGLASAACLARRNISFMVIEAEVVARAIASRAA
jgi:2-polyprenyl-6-methoxyphenol hydroxylase-like FAD-dependent oxidoreductase